MSLLHKKDLALWFSTPKDFSGCLETIAELEKLLSCNSCKAYMKHPVTLWSCDHVFCQSCVVNMARCHVCSLPAWQEDQKENLAVTNIARLTLSLKELLHGYMKQTNQVSDSGFPVKVTENGDKNSGFPQTEEDTDYQTTMVADKKVTTTKEVKLPQRRSNFKITPSKHFPDIPTDSEDSVGGNTTIMEDKNGETNDGTSSKEAAANKTPLRDVKNTPKFATPPLLKRKRNASLPFSPEMKTPKRAERKTPKRFSTPQRSPSVRTPKTPKSSKKNKRGETPLHIAAMKGKIDDMKTLIKEGVDLNAKDNAGWTPLHEACNHGHIDAVRELMVAGAFVNTPGYEDETPLMDAVLNGHSDIVTLLLEHGADISLRNASGKTASDLTTNKNMIKILEDHNSSPQKNAGALKSATDSQEIAPEEIRISFSSSVSNEKIKNSKKILNAIVNMEDATTATHYIVSNYEDGRSPRTIKYMQAVARGVWIVKCEWLDACTTAGGWVAEQKFEISGSKEDILLGGPMKSRLNRLGQCPAIFHGCHFYLSGYFKSSNPSKQKLGELLQLAGGVLLTREPKPDNDNVQTCTKVPYHAVKESAQYFHTYYIVYDGEQGKPSRMVRQGKVCTVPLTWIFDCISQFCLCEIPE